MKYLTHLTLFCLSVFFPLVLSLSPTYAACQLQKSAGESALSGCPKGTLYVSPTDSSAHFDNIQEAVDSLPETGEAFILIGQGQYFEMINVTRTAPLTLLGQLDPATANVPGGNSSSRNLVQIWNNRCVGNGWTDEETATLTVAAHSGDPFGNIDFRAYNINFENRATNYPISQALVTSITLANASFYGCGFSGMQDTWYTGWGSNTYAVDCVLYGTTDFIFGCGTAWFQSVTLAIRGCGGGITAWASTPGTTNGVYINRSRIIRSPDASADAVTTQNCYLGRPWNEYAVSIFLKNYMDDSIQPTGFAAWSPGDTIPNTTHYAEFHSYGPGSNESARVPQDHILSSEEAEKYTMGYVFQGEPSWVDTRYVH